MTSQEITAVASWFLPTVCLFPRLLLLCSKYGGSEDVSGSSHCLDARFTDSY